MMLTVADIETFYGPSQALFGVSFGLEKGQVLAMLGRNGMGKSTSVRSICRLSPPKAGSITFDGRPLDGMKPFQVARAGIGLVPEGRRCFPNLTVAENMIATAQPGPWTFARAVDLFPRLAERAGQMANSLSGGEQQMLAIARALMTNPKLLILDEATEGLAPVIRQEIWAAIKSLKQDGLSLIVVDKTLSELLPIADRCVILEKGKTAWGGAPDDLTHEIRDRYLGV